MAGQSEARDLAAAVLQRVGLDPDALVYSGSASTANGIVRTMQDEGLVQLSRGRLKVLEPDLI